jgi:hypothetical protein
MSIYANDVKQSVERQEERLWVAVQAEAESYSSGRDCLWPLVSAVVVSLCFSSRTQQRWLQFEIYGHMIALLNNYSKFEYFPGRFTSYYGLLVVFILHKQCLERNLYCMGQDRTSNGSLVKQTSKNGTENHNNNTQQQLASRHRRYICEE